MSRLCLDTSAYSRLMRGQSRLQDRLERAELVLLPVTVLGELHAGFELGSRTEENTAALEGFLSLPGIDVINTTHAVGERYGRLVRELRERGTPIPTNDIWIAAAALETGARLVSYDLHFQQVPGVVVESP